MCRGVANISVSAEKILDIKTMISDASYEQKCNAALRLRQGGTDWDLVKSMGSANECNLEDIMLEGGKRYHATIGSTEESTARVKFVTKFFKVFEIAVRILNIIMMGFMTVVSALQISKDVRENGYTTAACLSIVSTSMMCISFICEGASLTLDLLGITYSVVPVIGVVAAFLGLVCSLAASAVHVQMNPVVEFAKKHLVPFLDSLPIPSEEWINDRKTTVSTVRAGIALT